ncbi:hypothetical protein QR680_004660 [Steinernema hermaphroditum]|uniref:G-protein coupled receptors family 1 profile domain-containing protein n=1 Tax=Steinernema hermaphroditum TaxID=289476 RepID=A0AA39HRQ1_9BILA|nr:hypothetical protein QR680_004660 [Steinernema hermaphroditum]
MASTSMRTTCFSNLTTDERIEIFMRKRDLRLEVVLKAFFGKLAIPFASVALAFTIIFIIVVFNAIKQRRVSRKCYILLLNRAIGDVLACFCCLMSAAYVLIATNVNRDIVGIMETFFIASFWSAMVSYVSLSILKLYAVARPFFYRRVFTLRRCVYLVIFSWVVFAIMATYALTVSALVKIPALNEWSGCKIETCMRTMFRLRNFLTVTVYLFTIISFFITVFFIRRAQRFVDSFQRKRDRNDPASQVRFPLWKLALNVGTFGLLYIFYAIWAAALVMNRDKCFFQRHVSEMARILGLIRITLLIRILIDPLISFVTDFQIRRGVLELFHIKNNRITTDSRNKILHSSSSSHTPQTPGDLRPPSVKTVA